MAIHNHGNGSRDAAILLLRKGDVAGILRGDGGHDYIITILAGKLMGDGGLFLVLYNAQYGRMLVDFTVKYLQFLSHNLICQEKYK